MTDPTEARPYRDSDPTDWDETVTDPDPASERSAPDGAPWDDQEVVRQAALTQRFVHGALGALHDAEAARERRIAAILDAVSADAESSLERHRATFRIGWWLPAAAALALVAVIAWTVSSGIVRPPALDAAALSHAARELTHGGTDREFELLVEVRRGAAASYESLGRHALFCRSDGRIRIEFDHRFLGGGALVHDGRDAWLRAGPAEDFVQISRSGDSRESIRDWLNGPLRDGGFFDLGHLQIGRLLQFLLESNELVFDRSDSHPDFEAPIHWFRATSSCETAFGRLHGVRLMTGPRADSVELLEFHLRGPFGDRDFHFTFRHLGVRVVEDGFYRPR